MSKMCGNCGRDHKFVDCPYIDMQFPITKKEYAELKAKTALWDEHDFGYCQDKKFREKYVSAIRNILAINEDRVLTNPLYLDDLRKDFKEITGEEFKAIGT